MVPSTCKRLISSMAIPTTSGDAITQLSSATCDMLKPSMGACGAIPDKQFMCLDMLPTGNSLDAMFCSSPYRQPWYPGQQAQATPQLLTVHPPMPTPSY
jgi:hypothetical protein